MKKKVYFKPVRILKRMGITKIVVLLSILIAFLILLHDFIVWALLPVFTGNFLTLTYTGLFVDLLCAFVLESGIQYIKEL